MTSGRQSDIGANTSRSPEARWIVDRRLEAKCGDRADTRRGHEPADLHIITGQLQNLTVEIADLLLDGPARCEQRSDRSHQLRTILNQLLGSHGEDVELGAPVTRPRFLRRPRIWFSRSRLILTSNARLARSALIDWLS